MTGTPRSARSPKSGRKSRLLRAPASLNDLKRWPAKFEPTAEDWAGVERAYGVCLNEAQRKLVQDIIATYLWGDALERSAPFLVDAQQFLEQIDLAALNLSQALHRRIDQPELNLAREWIKMLIGDKMREQVGGKFSEQQITDFVNHLMHACSEVQVLLEHPQLPRFVDGEHWRTMVCMLLQWASIQGFPIAIRKDQARSRDKERPASPIVEFVHALQELLPPERRRHHSRDALATEISKLLRLVRKLNPSVRVTPS